MPSTKILGGNEISDADPLQVTTTTSVIGASSSPDNKQVTLTSGASAQIVAAAADGTKTRQTMMTSAAPWYIALGAPADANKFLVPAGAIYTSSYLGAINGYQASGASTTLYVISEAR